MSKVGRLAVAPPMIARHPRMRAEMLAAFPEAVLYEGSTYMTEDKLIAFLEDCDSAVIGFEPLTERVLSALPKLRVVSKYGAGCEHIDFHAMQRHGVRFGYTWGVNKLSVAELTLCFMIAAQRWIMPLNLSMRGGERPTYRNGRLLTGRTVGIHGCGNIGKEVIRLLQPFGCEILACDIQDHADFYRQYNVSSVSMDELIARSEVLSLHLPRTPKTLGLYSKDIVFRIRDQCALINTCRGGIVDEDALLERLDANTLMAAAFDVFAIEPAENDRLIRHPNMLATPHIGASTEETRLAIVRAAIRGLTEHEEVDPSRFYAT
ncbi:NAD(P)-dependent oxidoreductase [Roseiarcaceae bacterium H3SJ34-1]|uniref:NAD(P)-dependent oxidoreductase n=1 Tax=Terripilifer ovatus TaxID=3032367 RepID=UPI003AB94324|nr:NAD(P)-dependent oxidoreductase [Roseiarcaceae bacterium H3SJ34-1]